jgi:hypothetical protein
MIAQAPDSPLAAANDLFHDAYSGAQDGVRNQVPVLVVLPTELVLCHCDERQRVPYSRPLFERAKTAAHIAVALFTYTTAESKPAETRASVARLLTHISAALDASEPSEPNRQIEELLQRCRAFAAMASEEAPPEHARAEFASDAGPRILRITELATAEQVSGLHDAVEATLGRLSAHDQAALQVVVVGDHQARTRSLGMQYFKRRFREGDTDERVTYGENVNDEDEAVLLVAKRRLDQRIARAFFGDERRLQRDVLGDAAKRCLEQMNFSP